MNFQFSASATRHPKLTREIFSKWAALASHSEIPELPASINIEAVNTWAKELLCIAHKNETHRPRAETQIRFSPENGEKLRLLWMGTFSEGREVVVEIMTSLDTQEVIIYAEGCTGTGRPSTFLEWWGQQSELYHDWRA